MVVNLVGQIQNLPVEEVPPLIYQLLLLANKGRKAAVVKGIIDSMSKLEASVVTSTNSESETCR